MDVSVIIVNYNTREMLLQCLESVYGFTHGIDYEVIVVDNASSDGSCEAVKAGYPQARVIEPGENLGFGKANNLGARAATGKYLFLLNSDCLMLENTVRHFFHFMETNNTDGSIGAAGALLLDKERKQGYSYHRFPTFSTEIRSTFSVFIGKISKRLYDYFEKKTITRTGDTNEVECILGADMFIPASVYETLGGFDEQFFLYFEETDLQKRMAEAGLRRLILRDQTIIHYGEGSSGKGKPSLRKWIRFNESRFRYCRKHWSWLKYSFFYVIMFPALAYPLMSRKYPGEERRAYFHMLIRKKSRAHR